MLIMILKNCINYTAGEIIIYTKISLEPGHDPDPVVKLTMFPWQFS